MFSLAELGGLFIEAFTCVRFQLVFEGSLLSDSDFVGTFAIARKTLSGARFILLREAVSCLSFGICAEVGNLVLFVQLFVIGGDDSGITNENIVFIKLGFAMVALPAERHVHICTSN